MEDFLLSLIISCIFYPAFPIGYVILKKRPKLNLQSIKKITLINSIVIWSLFFIVKLILALNGAEQPPANIVAAITWCYINRAILKHFCYKEEKNTDSKKQDNY